MYRSVPPRIDLPAMEREILAEWKASRVFERSLEQTQGRPQWVFYEGPPTANGKPGTHHVEARVFKDVFPRYRTMKGFHVPRKAGWDCHGLPVELAVEKELGFSNKNDIEAYGIAEFNKQCRESVYNHVDEFTAMTERMAYWCDMDDAYWTMDASYVESVWWSLKQIFDKGLLVQDHRVAPYCPRCGTGLSDHELAQGYESITDPSVFVRFPVTSGDLLARHPGLALLVWTTTPWTLVSNTAVAANPAVDYDVVRNSDGECYVIASNLRVAVLGEDSEVLETVKGTDLEGVFYDRPFHWVEFPLTDAPVNSVLLADYVTVDDGTGLVHQAPAFGADDLITCRKYGLPVVNPIRPDGTFDDDVPEVGGVFFKSADARLVELMQQSGVLFRHLAYEHQYPHCWRCHTALIYYAQPSWYIRTTAIKDALLRENEGTNWFPETIKWGRYGDWLHNNIDWALSRKRYWGTPLPIWRCSEDHFTAIGSLAELSEKCGHDVSSMDPHRPYVDDVTFPCPHCGETATRVPEVIDGWYDSGSMPFAQFGYPHKTSELDFKAVYPADFICEAIDQTRGWFYTLMAVGTLVFDQSSYKNVVCLGHILDDQGRKMSKHLGNVLEPISLMDEHGADAVRWFMLAGGSPWQARRVGHATIAEVVRKTLLTYWNTVSFQALYARESDFEPTRAAVAPIAERPILDRWAVSEAHRLSRDVDAALDQFDTQRAGKLIAEYVDDLSNWYVRRSRRRFWEGDPNALMTLHECLQIVTLVMAPFTPFITERVWSDLFHATSTTLPDSVHLAAWPDTDPALISDALSSQVALVRRLVELGRGARAEAKVKTRQPLSRALIGAQGWESLDPELKAQVAEELNVQTLQSLMSSEGNLVDVAVKANFRTLGARFGKQTPLVANAVAACDAAALSEALRLTGTATVHAGELGEVSLNSEEVVVTETPREGWAVSSESGASVALDLTITDDLRRLGQAREIVRLLQDGRKAAGFEVSDRISVHWQTRNASLGEAVVEHASAIAGEVLALEFTQGISEGHEVVDDELGFTARIARV
jgi:isoleucyl-tRNA synthetase